MQVLVVIPKIIVLVLVIKPKMILVILVIKPKMIVRMRVITLRKLLITLGAMFYLQGDLEPPHE